MKVNQSADQLLNELVTACTVGLERQSATTLLFPLMCLISIVNSDMKARWHCCRNDQGSETLDIA